MRLITIFCMYFILANNKLCWIRITVVSIINILDITSLKSLSLILILISPSKKKVSDKCLLTKESNLS